MLLSWGLFLGQTADVNLNSLLNSFAELVASKLRARPTDPGGESARIQPRLLTVEQAAMYLGRTKDAVQHMIGSGKLPIIRTDRRVFLDLRDLDQWIEQSKIQ
jgi:excisionase family DNA binding protein